MNDRIATLLSRVMIANPTCRRILPVGGKFKLELVEPRDVV